MVTTNVKLPFTVYQTSKWILLFRTQLETNVPLRWKSVHALKDTEDRLARYTRFISTNHAGFAELITVFFFSRLQLLRLTPIGSFTKQRFPSVVCFADLGCSASVLQECEEGYTRTGSGLYLGTCERCDCNGYASGCDPETGRCLVGLMFFFRL